MKRTAAANWIAGTLIAAVLGTLVSIADADAADLLNPIPNSTLYGPTPVWTDGTTTPIFHPLTGPMPSNGLGSIRVSAQLSQLSGPCRFRPALRFSSDGITWNAEAALDPSNLPYMTTNNITNYGQWIDITSVATPAAYVQIGVQAANASAGATGFCNATLRVQVKSN